MNPLIVIACEDGRPAPAALAALAALQGLDPGGSATLLACGASAAEAAPALAALPGVALVLVLAADVRPERLAPWLAQRVREAGHSHLLATAGAWARALLPRTAALLDVMAVSDVVALVDEHCVLRPVHAGSALFRLRLLDAVKVFSVRGSAFAAPALPPPGATPSARLQPVQMPAGDDRATARLEARSRPASDGEVQLIGARVVVSGGRGTGSAEGYARLQPLAQALGAALGASRAAVDAGFAPSDRQVGQTGKSVAPELYLALGISGAVQHWAGMKDSKVIVAVNRDADAPIFQFADYGLVADLFEVLPALQAGLAARAAG
ncbi:MAG: FAD-binding protein [Burkholderiaceae bacterium]|nr:FAD-binding protein [Burkholderiaceae bacterium]